MSVVDAFVEINATQWLAVQMGRFRVSTSFDRLISVSVIAVVNRSQLTKLTEGRLIGAEVIGHHDFGSAALKLQVRVFGRGDVSDPSYVLNARVLVSLPSGLALHAAFASEIVRPENLTPAAFTDQIDLAVQFAANGWTARAEGLIVLDTPTDEMAFGAYGELLYSAKLSNGTELEPGIHYGMVSVDSVLSHRTTLGLTW